MVNVPSLRLSANQRISVDRVVLGAGSDTPAPVARLSAKWRAGYEALPAAPRRDETAIAGRAGTTELMRTGLPPLADWSIEELGHWLEARIVEARRDGVARLALALPDAWTASDTARRVTLRRLLQAAYRFDSYRSRPASRVTRRGRILREVVVLVPRAALSSWRRAEALEAAVGAASQWARDLANTPPNVASPSWIVTQARALARRHRLRIQVLGPPELRRRSMGGVLAVGSGSRHAPQLVRIEGGSGPTTVALVGKGVTFDSGGISIKPAAAMDEMKYDKSGACTVLGVIDAICRAGVPVRFRAYLALAENMLDGAAYRPGDIIRCANGTSVEITNTDAEGRLLLADALSWAAAEKPDSLVEFSTLTGACVVALGHEVAGLFSPSDELATELANAADRAGEAVWRLPMGPRFLADMRGVHADLRNSGGRWGGASAAASFLGEFAKPVSRWAHFDIAGPAYTGHEGGAGPGLTRGATGFGIATTVEWLQSLATSRPVAKRRSPPPRARSTGVR